MKLCARQICFLFAAVLPVTRLLVYPATLSYWAKNDLLFAAGLSFIAEGTAVAAVLFVASRTQKTFFQLLESNFGNAAARAVYLLFALFFAFSALLPILEQRGFVLQVFYENVPSFLSFLPFFLVSLFACAKGLRSMGRAADLALPVFAVCFGVLFLMAVTEGEYAALLPLFGAGTGILRGGAFGLPWYAGGAYMLFFLGNFRCEKGAAGKILLSYAAGALAVLAFLAAFYAIFSDIALLQQNALAHLSKYATAFTSLGRIDLFFVFALTLVLLFALCIPLQMSVHCICTALSCKPLVPALAINALLLALTLFFNQSYLEIQTLMTQKLWIVYAFFAMILPYVTLFLRRKENKSLPCRQRRNA